ncbi:MAG TPA: peptidase [Bacteroidetes bacterium]|nr:peptidase [Bacteroidota bacterium]
MYNYYQKKYKSEFTKNTIFSLVILIFFIVITLATIHTLKGLVVILTLIILIFTLVFYYMVYEPLSKWKKVLQTPFPDAWRKILEKNVTFYNTLDEDEKDYFEKRIQYFLETKKITGVNTDIDDKIKILIAASAIMPVFAFPDFVYDNINEILVYPNSFDEEYNTGDREKILGMVGNGSMNRMMILSKPDILNAFSGRRTVHNVALHEFVHLIDKKDGSIDGIPEILIDKAFVLPWLRELKIAESKIKKRKSDIDPYALTNNSEFLAVASEYFFMSPKKFQKNHPELYKYFTKIYKRKLKTVVK